jgi:putative protease
MTDRDANRGGCAQSCRWYYQLYRNQGGLGVPLFSEGDVPYTMSSRDLSMIGRIKDLLEVEVDSLKIEGRMKSIHYVATIVNAYRRALELTVSGEMNEIELLKLGEEVKKASHRPLFTGFYDGVPGVGGQIYGKEAMVRKYDFVGQVLEFDEEQMVATIQQRNNFKVGDEVEFFGPSTGFVQVIREIMDQEGERLDVARHPLEIIKVRVDEAVQPFDMLRKESSLIFQQ